MLLCDFFFVMLKSCDHIKILDNGAVELTFAACEDLRDCTSRKAGEGKEE